MPLTFIHLLLLYGEGRLIKFEEITNSKADQTVFLRAINFVAPLTIKSGKDC